MAQIHCSNKKTSNIIILKGNGQAPKNKYLIQLIMSNKNFNNSHNNQLSNKIRMLIKLHNNKILK